MENIGGHYAKTLRLWRESFMSNFDAKIKPALIEKHGIMTDDAIAVFRRKWEVSVLLWKNVSGPPLISAQYYFKYCEAGFLSKTLGDVIITVGREGAMELMEGIPI